MKKIIYLFFLITIQFSGVAQIRTLSTKSETFDKKIKNVICPADFTDANTTVELPLEIRQALERRKARGEKGIAQSSMVVEYVDFSDQAKTAFQRAIDIWSETVASNVPIRVIALWQPLGKNVLGSATPSDFKSYFPGIAKAQTWYPMPLAEKMAGKDLNSINEYDIVCRFSSDANWYYGDINPAVGQFDLTSVVLHELCHGLGFVGSMSVSDDNTTGEYGYGTGRPFIFDTFAENGIGKKLIDTSFVKNTSTALKNQLISDDLYFNGPITFKKNNTKPKLYAPNPWEQGSSFSHLDDATYPAGTINSLMTPTASYREKDYNPGPLTLSIFEDMGWKRTAIVHEPIKDYTSTGDVTLNAKILSDTTVDYSSAKLIYSTNFNQTTGAFIDSVIVPLTKINATDFQAKFALGTTAKTVLYYLTVNDKLTGGKVTSPPQAPYYIWSFSTGKTDKYGPLIDYSAPTVVPTTSNFLILANVEDDFTEGIDTVYVNYSLNGVSKPSFGLKKYNFNTDSKDLSQGAVDEFAYFKEGAFGTLNVNDKVSYQIVAKDKSGNQTIIPTRSEGSNQADPNVATFYDIVATTLKTTVDTYTNDFENTSNDDFALLGFSIGKPNSFNSNILYTNGGYSNGKGLADPATGSTYLDFKNNQIALLRSPLKLGADNENAIITFDEVVLVEPGENGAVYGDSDFWDYVIVEGSYDGGVSWVPFADGYDSGSQTVWKNRFNNTLTAGTTPISTGVGEQSLMKQRVINIYDGQFADVDPGTEVIVRFRLYADQWVRGWGWAIDNLRLQTPAPKPLASETISKPDIGVFPNPTSDFITVNVPLSKPQKVKFEVYQVLGTKVSETSVDATTTTLTQKIDVSNLFPGNYILKIVSEDGYKAKRFVINR